MKIPEDFDKGRQINQELFTKDVDDFSAYKLIRDLAETGYSDASANIERFLLSNVPEIRQASLQTLVYYFAQTQYAERCKDMLLFDDDEEVRGTAASCLGTIFKGSKSHGILKLLATVVIDRSFGLYVRSAAYNSFLNVMGIAPNRWPSAANYEHFEERVDWDFVHKWSEVKDE